MIYTRAHILILLFTLLLTPVCLFAGQAPSVSVATAVKGEWHSQHSAFGRVFPLRKSILKTPFMAQVTAVKVNVGERVRSGQILAALRSPELTALLSSLRMAEQEVRLTKHRAQALTQSLSEKAVTRSTKLEADIDLVKANNRLTAAWQKLDKTLAALGQQQSHDSISESLKKFSVTDFAARFGVVRAPFNGLVVERNIGAGQRITPGAPLFTIEDISGVYISVGVPEGQLFDWQVGTATAETPDGVQKLTRVSPEPLFDSASGLWLLLYITGNRGLRLQDGAWLKANLSGPARSVLRVPESSVVERNGQTYCIREIDGKYKAVAIKAGPAEEGTVPVLSGLKANDRVVTEGAYELLYRDLNELMKFVD